MSVVIFNVFVCAVWFVAFCIRGVPAFLIPVTAHSMFACAIWRSMLRNKPKKPKPAKPAKLPRAIVLLVLLASCTTDPVPRAYTCTVLYRCHGDDITARVGAVCAVDDDEAAEIATQLAIDAARLACPATWQYVRPLCQLQLPETACDPTR